MSKPQNKINLLLLIVNDLARHSGRVLLFLMLVLSAGAVILSTHHNRQMNIELEKLMQERDQLDVEWRHLVLEQGTLTEHNRIEALVTEKLDMRRPSPKEEVVVRIK